MKNDSPWIPGDMPGDSSFDMNHDGKLSGNETFNRDYYWNTEGKDYISNDMKNSYSKSYGTVNSNSNSDNTTFIVGIIAFIIVFGGLYVFGRSAEAFGLYPKTALLLLILTAIFYAIIHFVGKEISNPKDALIFAVSLISLSVILIIISFITRYGFDGAFALFKNLFTHTLDKEEFYNFNDKFSHQRKGNESSYTFYISLIVNAVIFTLEGIVTAIIKIIKHKNKVRDSYEK